MPTPVFSTGLVAVTQARDEVGTGSNPIGSAIKDTDIARRLTEIEDEFVNAPLERGVMGWPFLEEETIILTSATTPLNGAIASGATSLIVDDASIWTDPADLTIEAGFIRTGNNIYDFFNFEDISSNTIE